MFIHEATSIPPAESPSAHNKEGLTYYLEIKNSAQEIKSLKLICLFYFIAFLCHLIPFSPPPLT